MGLSSQNQLDRPFSPELGHQMAPTGLKRAQADLGRVLPSLAFLLLDLDLTPKTESRICRLLNFVKVCLFIGVLGRVDFRGHFANF